MMSSHLEIGPDTGVIRGPERGIVRVWAIEADTARRDGDRAGGPDIVDATIHAWPIGMRDRAVAAGERREGGRRGLARAEAARHQRRGGLVERRVEIAADDACCRFILAPVDPGEELLHLEEAERIIA